MEKVTFLETFNGVSTYPCKKPDARPLLDYVRVIKETGKAFDIPVLDLVLDEQTGKTGNITRIEAFVDLIKRKKMKKEGTI